MNAQLQEIVQKVVNSDYNDLVELGRTSFAEAFTALQSQMDEKTVAGLILGIVGLTIAADNYASEKEVKLFNDITGLGWSFEQVKGFAADSIDVDFAKSVQSVIASVDSTTRVNLFLLALTIASADETVKADELRLLCGLFGY